MTDSPHEEHRVVIELTQLKEQVKTVGENVSEIRASVAALISLDKTIAELAIYSKHTQENVRALADGLEELKRKQQAHEHKTSEVKRALSDAIDAGKLECTDKIGGTDRKVDAWINQAKGASWASGLILAVVQVVIFGSIAWVFTTVTQVRDMSREHELRLEQFESRNGLTHPKLNQEMNSDRTRLGA